MYFEDGFKLSQEEVNSIVRWAFVYQVQVFNKEGKTSFLSAKLIEAALKKLDITSLDFLNDASILIVQNALLNAMDFLKNKEVISALVNDKDAFLKFFTKKQLFSSREFSQEFEADLVLTLLYKLDFNYHYTICQNYEQFYKNYLTNEIIETANKFVDIRLTKKVSVKVLPLPKHLPKTNIKNAMKEYDYSTLCDYICLYNKSKNLVTLLPTISKEMAYELEKEYIFEKLDNLTVAVNVEGKLKQELILY